MSEKSDNEEFKQQIKERIARLERLQDRLLNSNYVYRFRREGPGHRVLVAEKRDDGDGDDGDDQ